MIDFQKSDKYLQQLNNDQLCGAKVPVAVNMKITVF
jgi:hypothetical protein